MRKNKNIKLKYILVGGFIGFFVGLIFFIIGFYLIFDEWYFASIGFPFGLGEVIGRYLGFGGYGRIIPYFFGGIIVYTVLGVIISMGVLHYIKSRKLR